MCHSTDLYRRYSDRDRLKIKSFFVKFSGFGFRPTPESLTLLYLPRIDETELEVDGTKIRPDSPAFLTLHRAVLETEEGDVVFGCRERVKASEGVRFVVFVGDEKALKGIFRRDGDDDKWRLECKCELQTISAGAAVADVAVAEVCVGVDVGGGRGGHVALCERVKMAVGERSKRRMKKRFHKLEEIPEERTVDCESDGQCCCSCSREDDDGGSSDGEDKRERYECDGDLEMEIEGVRWAVDLGIWVMCLGVGFLASKASAKALRRGRIF